ncbi:sigma-70 family RNA polymerase sigma factor [Hyphomicrobium sp. DY-1]|uniref:sigma-70 family RNA polymerase sigma factor n=1 Tax=Hyphomicrobium sp. DY-1 TaxID=3075650 RepID=UPI0039C10942
MSDLVDEAEEYDAQVAAYRPVLLKLALVQLQDQATAEDAVQETLVAALSGRKSFRQEASIKTWLVSILKHKILDIIRSKKRYQLAPSKFDDSDYDTSAFDALFDETGCWRDTKDPWTDPESVTERAAFFKVLEACLSRLPEKTSRAFMMREWLDIDADEIQRLLKITPGHLRILLYRARMQLRLCMDINWRRG